MEELCSSDIVERLSEILLMTSRKPLLKNELLPK
jgi:hypothetical protein